MHWNSFLQNGKVYKILINKRLMNLQAWLINKRLMNLQAWDALVPNYRNMSSINCTVREVWRWEICKWIYYILSIMDCRIFFFGYGGARYIFNHWCKSDICFDLLVLIGPWILKKNRITKIALYCLAAYCLSIVLIMISKNFLSKSQTFHSLWIHKTGCSW